MESNSWHRSGVRGLTVRSLYQSLLGVLWVALLITIPVTSFPPVSRLAGGTVVSPLSLIPLIGLLLLWFIPGLVTGRRLPRISVPLLAFALVAALATALSPFHDLFPFRGDTVVEQGLEGVGTLAIGLGYYFVVSTYPRDDRALRQTLRWLYLGLVILLAWATIQVVWITSGIGEVPTEWQNIHRLFSIRDASSLRATGLAYEPSWLADQLLMIYLPLLLASVLRRETVLGIRVGGLTMELLLLLWGVTILYFTFSRIGLLAFLALAAALAAWFSVRAASRGQRKPRVADGRGGGGRGRLQRAGAILLLALLGFVAIAVLAVFLGSVYDRRLALVFQIDYLDLLRQQRHPIEFLLAARLGVAERVMYWAGGLGVFSRYPFLGVGLGNAGFLYPETVPYFGYYLPEIIRAVSPGVAGIPNVKSLWIRLLAETGVVGFLFFVVWLLLVGAAALETARGRRGIRGVIGLAALFALLELVFEGFSLDTFALPQLWVVFGLLTCSALLRAQRESPRAAESDPAG